MVKITCKIRDELTQEQLRRLYEDAGWLPYTCDMAKVKRAIDGSLCIITAWYNHELVGLLRAVGDGETVLYLQDLIVMRSHRRHKIATEMVEKLIRKYPNVRQKVLMAEDSDDIRGFYEEVGFMACDQGDLIGFTRFD